MSEFGGKKASIGLGVAVAVALGAVGVAATTLSLGAGNNDYTIKVHFATANGLIEGSDVFIGGVKVGSVSRVIVDDRAPADNGNSSFADPTSTAVVTVNIKQQYAPLHGGATAAVRPKSLLGEKYVAMTVGDPSKDAIADGATLPPEATSVNVELDQLISVFDAATRKQLQTLIANLGTGLAGQGRTTNQTVQVGRQDLGNLAQVTDVLQARDAELKRIIEALSKITQSLATDQQLATYPDLLAHSDTVLKTLIAEDADVAQGIDRMNAFFGVLDAGLAGRQQDLQAVLASLPRTVSDLDALALTLGPQGHVAFAIAQKTAPGVVAGDLIFGATPAASTYTNDAYTRVMPAQGCYSVNTRYADANGFAYDAPPTTRPGANNVTPFGMCTTPTFANDGGSGRPCANGFASTIDAILCGNAVAGSLCVTFGFNSTPGTPVTGGCNGLTGGIGGPFTAGSTQGALPGARAPVGGPPQRGALGLPLPQPSTDNRAANQLLRYLLQ
jgi:virulence factor Mce-like protein